MSRKPSIPSGRHRRSAPTPRRCARRYRLPVRPDPASTQAPRSWSRRHRGGDPPRVRESAGGGRGRGRHPRAGREGQRLPDRPHALRQGQRDHGALLPAALSGTGRRRRRAAAPRSARRGRVRPAILAKRNAATQAQGCARPPQVAESREKTTLFSRERRWAGQDARIQRFI